MSYGPMVSDRVTSRGEMTPGGCSRNASRMTASLKCNAANAEPSTFAASASSLAAASARRPLHTPGVVTAREQPCHRRRRGVVAGGDQRDDLIANLGVAQAVFSVDQRAEQIGRVVVFGTTARGQRASSSSISPSTAWCAGRARSRDPNGNGCGSCRMSGRLA